MPSALFPDILLNTSLKIHKTEETHDIEAQLWQPVF
jgi:hypothetical protein